MSRIILILPLFLLIISLEASGAAAGHYFSSGTYEMLSLAIDRAGNVTGYFREEQGTDVTKTCSFFLSGKVTSDEIKVLTWSDQVFEGKLRAMKDGVELKILEGREHSGCGLVLLPLIEKGLPLDMVREAQWTHLRQIPKKVVLYSTASPGKYFGFLGRGEVVGVIAEKAGWLKVESLGEKKLEGWIRADAATKLEAPHIK